jgi:hypothetical protein
MTLTISFGVVSSWWMEIAASCLVSISGAP